MSEKKVYPNGPKSKWAKQAQEIAVGEIHTDAADIPMLLEWLQDSNWPGAEIIAEYIAAQPEGLVEPLRMVLKSRDYLWIANTLRFFVSDVGMNVWVHLMEELKRIAFGYDNDNAHIEAMKILAIHQMVQNTVILNRIAELSTQEAAEDYRELENLVKSRLTDTEKSE